MKSGSKQSGASLCRRSAGERNWRFRRPRLAAGLCAGLSGLFCSMALAGEAPEQAADLFALDLEALLQVNVTGSHIQGRELSSVGPVSVIDRDSIARSGATSLETLLQRLPASAGYAGNHSNAYWAVNGGGSAHVNLRGLGINRTLVLLNGRRLAAGGTGANAAVDLNMIPLALVERIEILKDGASALYGADAVAGVVNIITRQQVNGVEVTLRYGETSQQDGAEQAADLAWGIQHANYQLLLSFNHAQMDAVNMADRAPCGLGEVGGTLICTNSSNTIGGRALLSDGRRVNFNQTLGGDGDFFEPYAPRVHNFNPNPYLNAVNPIERNSVSALGSWRLQPQLTLFGEFSYGERESEQLASPGTIGLNRVIALAADHPSNPTGLDLVLERRRLLEAGARQFFQEVDHRWLVLGLDGRTEQDWNWRLSAQWHRNRGVDGITQLADLDRIDATLDTNRCSNSIGAAIPCADYLGYGDVSAAVLDYILYTNRDHGGNSQRAVSASLNGKLLELPAGPLAFAAGLEWRQERGWRSPDPRVIAGIANTNQQAPTRGETLAQEAFAELNLPLLRDHAWAQSLQLNGVVRYSNSDRFASETTYKAGIDWQIVNSLKLRSHYSTAFRTPNIFELFSGNYELNLITSDPCSGWAALPSTSARYQNCLAAGVPVGFTQLSSTVLTSLGGNPDLDPEESKSWTAGVVWHPTDSAQLTVTLDYFDITIDDAIVSADGSTKLAICYDDPGLQLPFCNDQHFRRDPVSGELSFLSVQQFNAAREQLSGVDLGVAANWQLADWQLQLNWEASYLRRYDLTAYPGADTQAFAGGITSGRGSYPHWRSLLSLQAETGRWSGRYSLQYLDGADDLGAPAGSIGDEVPSVSYHYVQLQYAFSPALNLSVGIDNLFDRSAPYLRNWLDANTDTMTYDLLGRRWYLRAGYRW